VNGGHSFFIFELVLFQWDRAAKNIIVLYLYLSILCEDPFEPGFPNGWSKRINSLWNSSS